MRSVAGHGARKKLLLRDFRHCRAGPNEQKMVRTAPGQWEPHFMEAD
ncbi:hypothetical protein AHiyo1_31070 [Arthrobacter sp. Hiyo1]|nr:hypothetical protein AHiyo1_31070 [Arthrobacter sp. Hiyo1]